MPSETHEYHLSSGWSAFLADFMDGRVAEAEAGDWFEWTLDWWQAMKKHPKQILFLHYERMLADPHHAVRQVATFLDVRLSDDQVENVVKRSSFKNMKKDHEQQMSDYEKKTGSITRRPGESQHFRKGQAGTWREVFSQEESANLDHLYAIRMADSGLTHDFG